MITHCMNLLLIENKRNDEAEANSFFGLGDIGQIARYYFDIDSVYQPVCFTVD